MVSKMSRTSLAMYCKNMVAFSVGQSSNVPSVHTALAGKER